ncbi:sigma-54 interaction domain-containing protein [Sporomusa sp.]|uniref:sigma-54 interaction domain-containing protein n=1 Tax=Sporomusa sp. TaxID=2078658 RepID=UPI002C145E51|nr:sigma 54-interacting transcriptional regulator [Sporomusa sp.]HWR05874.1 sigma 54-interacting transcriptional regulator [Sporomusa sp.]
MYENILNQMKTLFKNTDLIIIVDREGKIMYYNNFNDRLNKIGHTDAIGKTIFELYPWLTRENSTIFKVIETGEPLVNHLQNIKLDAENSIYALNTAFPLKNEQGIIGAIEISTDLSNKHKSLKYKRAYSNAGAKYSFDDIITSNNRMIELVNILKNSAQNNSNIFIYGETGTGKEIFAHAIHGESPRKNKPFIAQNCAAIPPSIMESLFFGSTKGSYTGAEDKPGLFELANGGTVYLDEINSMPLDLQAKLLRTIEDRTVRRIGDSKDSNVNIRIITSTNETPAQLLTQNRIRTDLFFRLNVVNIEIPPLRERKDDLDILLTYFIDTYNHQFNKNIKTIDPAVKTLFEQYQWPGNIREFRNCIESAFNLVDNTPFITLRHIPRYITDCLPAAVASPVNINNTLPLMMEEYEKETIKTILGKNNLNVLRTANELGIPRQTLYYKLYKYHLLNH